MLLHFGAGYRSNYFLVPSVTTTGEITNYNALTQLGLKGGLEYKWFPTITGLLSTSGAGGMVGHRLGSRDQFDYAEPLLQHQRHLGQGQPHV